MTDTELENCTFSNAAKDAIEARTWARKLYKQCQDQEENLKIMSGMWESDLQTMTAVKIANRVAGNLYRNEVKKNQAARKTIGLMRVIIALLVVLVVVVGLV